MIKTTERRAFDLATDHIVVEKRWSAPELRKAAPDSNTPSINPEHIRCRQLEQGTIILTKMLDYLASHSDNSDIGASTLAPAGLNSAWYTYARDRTDVGRRILSLPFYGGDAENITAANILLDAASTAEDTVHKATFATVFERHNRKAGEAKQLRMRLGQNLGYGALVLATAPEASRISAIESLDDRQQLVWEIGRKTLRTAHQLREEIGFDPTIDQLASPYSPLVAHINNSPELSNTLNALIYATDMNYVVA